MQLERSTLTAIRLPYPRPIHWKDSVEEGCEFMLLRLFTDDGLEGVAEGAIKPTWTGTTRRALVAVREDMLLPALEGVDLSDVRVVRQRLAPFPENRLAAGRIHVLPGVRESDHHAIARDQPGCRQAGRFRGPRDHGHQRRNVLAAQALLKEAPDPSAAADDNDDHR